MSIAGFHWLFTSKRERLLSCLSHQEHWCWDLPKSQSLSDITENIIMVDNDADDDGGDGSWPSLEMYHEPGPVLSASRGGPHWILITTWCVLSLTLQVQKLRLGKVNTWLKDAFLGNERTQAVSPKSQQLNMLFLNLNYILAPALIITVSYKIFELNWSSVWRFPFF